MENEKLLKKLQVKPGSTMLLLNAPRSFLDALALRKSYIGFTRGKIFAVAKASSKTRLDLGLKLRGKQATDRLADAGGFASGSITHKVALNSLEGIDEQVIEWLHEAYQEAH